MILFFFFSFRAKFAGRFVFFPPILQPFYFPSGQTITPEYYIKVILEKEVKPLTLRRQVTGDIRKESCLAQTRRWPLSRTARRRTLQRWFKRGVTRICQTLYPRMSGRQTHLIRSSPCREYLEHNWRYITYRDPAPKTRDRLKKRLRFAWKNVTQDTLNELAHSMPCRLKNVKKK